MVIYFFNCHAIILRISLCLSITSSKFLVYLLWRITKLTSIRKEYIFVILLKAFCSRTGSLIAKIPLIIPLQMMRKFTFKLLSIVFLITFFLSSLVILSLLLCHLLRILSLIVILGIVRLGCLTII